MVFVRGVVRSLVATLSHEDPPRDVVHVHPLVEAVFSPQRLEHSFLGARWTEIRNVVGERLRKLF